MKLQESGYELQMTFAEYCERAKEYGDNPADYSDNEDDFVFVMPEYAKQDPSWDVPAGWPEGLPLWECDRI